MALQKSSRHAFRDAFFKNYPEYRISSYFWCVTLHEGKTYTEKLTNQVHISMAALETNSDSDGPVFITIKGSNSNPAFCWLNSDYIPQQPLNLNFNKGEDVTVCLKGKGVVHITGHIMMNKNIFATIKYMDSLNDSRATDNIRKKDRYGSEKDVENPWGTEWEQQKQETTDKYSSGDRLTSLVNMTINS